MSELFVSFFAGILTVAAPCILPVLPVILGGSAVTTSRKGPSLLPVLTLIAGLVSSVILFTLLLKASTSLLGIPQELWQFISGSILLFFGLQFIFPTIWTITSTQLGLQRNSDKLLEQSSHVRGLSGSFLMGAALGPVFNSCSPTYALIVAVILPRSFGEGLVHLTVYALGLGIALLVIALLGRTAVQILRPLANPAGIFRKAIGVVFILVALLIITGTDKKAQEYILEHGWYDPIANFEHQLKR